MGEDTGMNWLISLFYGLVSGVTEIFPISAEAHRDIWKMLFDMDVSPFVDLLIHIGVLIALVISCFPQLKKLFRERKLMAVPPRRRKRQPDMVTLSNLRVLRVAILPLLLGFLILPLTHNLTKRSE